MVKRFAFLLTTVCSSIFSSSGQQLEYDIIWLGKIGKLHINKIVDNESLFIETNSEVKIPFYKFNWITSTMVINGKLQSSTYQQLLNDNKREFTEINYTSDNLWQVLNNDGKKDPINIKNQFYVSRLYFEEPVNEKYIFSERFGEPLELINNGNGHYKLLLPDNNFCEYFYENGICKLVKAKNGNRTIKMVLSEET